MRYIYSTRLQYKLQLLCNGVLVRRPSRYVYSPSYGEGTGTIQITYIESCIFANFYSTKVNVLFSVFWNTINQRDSAQKLIYT